VGLVRFKQGAALVAVIVGTTFAIGCGSSDDSEPATSSEAPAASTFPTTDGGTLDDILADTEPGDDLVVALAGSDFTVGKNRLAVGIFNVDATPNNEDLNAALYIAHGAGGKAEGPFPARREDLTTDAAFASQTTTTDPDAAKAVYVTDVDFKEPGEYRVVAVVDKDDGTRVATRVDSVDAQATDRIPGVGDKAPVIHTPTVDDVGDITEIDTRVPPDTLHNVDFADAVGKKPIVLLFATPALCQTRVCGPVADVVEQVKNERPDDAAYIHMEIWNENDPNKGARPQLFDYKLRTEPWLFVIDADGNISTRIEGAFSVGELNQALDRVKK
jgi:hypothetical protein